MKLIITAAFVMLVASSASAAPMPVCGGFDMPPCPPGWSPGTPLLSDFDPDIGGYRFYFEVVPGQRVYVDPDVAVGYIYQVDSASPLIASAHFATALTDADGYQIYALDAGGARGDFLGDVAVGGTFTFASAVSGFWLEGIDPINMVDPLNPQAFVAGFTFDGAGMVSLTQTPITTNVPEPTTWAMLLAGMGVVGAITRRRRMWA
jgi:hypothetical protein